MMSLLLLIFLLFIPASIVWIALDSRAHRIAIDKKPYALNNGALAWFFSAILLWIATFPLYLLKRSAALGARQTENGAFKTVPPIASPHGDGANGAATNTTIDGENGV